MFFFELTIDHVDSICKIHSQAVSFECPIPIPFSGQSWLLLDIFSQRPSVTLHYVLGSLGIASPPKLITSDQDWCVQHFAHYKN